VSLPSGYRLHTGPWQTLAPAARVVREAVFLVEQGIDPALEWDDADAGALHAVVMQGDLPVGTARLLPSQAGVARIGRMAVLASHRGRGLAATLLAALLQAAVRRGDREALLHAQCTVRRLYEQAGFVGHGPVFLEAGIEHVEMLRPLP
jgi:predicted GNAT family N-acyltransferase